MSDCLRWYTENFISTDVINALTASSEVTNFPKENAIDELQRTKLWRTEGFFKIVSGSNTIVFEETAATPLTATVAAAEYSSSTAFLAAIKAALEAAGGSTYTVTASTSTGKINIASDGAGGGGILTLIWTDAGSASMADIMGFDTAADQTGALSYAADILKLTTGEFLVFDLGMSDNPKAFALIGPRNTPLNIGTDAVVTLEGHEFNEFSSPSFSQVLTLNSKVLSTSDDTGLHTEALRYWRLSIDDPSNPNLFTELGFVYLGNIFTMDRGAGQFPLSTTHNDRSVTVTSEGGETFTDIRQKHDIIPLLIRFMTKEEREDMKFIFDKFGKATPFFVELDADLAFTTSREEGLVFVKMENSPTDILETPNNFGVRVSLREEL